MSRAFVIVALALAGCSPAVISGNSAGGIVKIWTSTSGGMKLAEAHCQKYGKVSRLSEHSFLSRDFAFDCVAP